jgi:hypothetical protein
VHDGAVVTWPEGEKKPKTRQLSNLVGEGALGGAFWGLLLICPGRSCLPATTDLGDSLSGTTVLTEKWPVLGRHEQAAVWLQIWGGHRGLSMPTPAG